MAVEQNSTKLREALLHERYTYSDTYIGTRAQLIAAGFAADGRLPGDPGMNKVSFTSVGPPKTRIIRLGKDRFEIFQHVSADEEAKREEARDRQSAIEQAKRREENILKDLPQSARAYRDFVLKQMVPGELFSPERLLHCGSGYRYDDEAVEAFRDAVEEACEVLRTGRIVFDSAKRQRILAGIKGKTAKADASFQTWLATTIATGEQP